MSLLRSRRKVLTNLVSVIPEQLEIGEVMGRVNDVLNILQPESLFVWRFVCAFNSSKSEGSNREVIIGSRFVGAVQGSPQPYRRPMRLNGPW